MGAIVPTMNAKEAGKLCAKIRAKAADLAELIRQLRDGAGWIPLAYPSWEACCREEFGYSKRHANYLIAANETQKRITSEPYVQGGTVGDMSPTPTPQPNDRQAAELSRLPSDQQAECWQDYLAECEANREKPTAKGLRAKVAELLDVVDATPEPETAIESCPNCGNTERTDDGDCSRCYDPCDDEEAEPLVESDCDDDEEAEAGDIIDVEPAHASSQEPTDPALAKILESVKAWLKVNKARASVLRCALDNVFESL